ncbi:Clan SC, family S9, unassigned serine peptidase [Tritrichomonas foetus]|uniref:Clan SC, family S9, unassigned serine peptidase n=1 Tax=Tritrichomonas foetus TaxID=1144522 RepID=A0A1J4J9L2_9EUKA|nr:Clan SC, family S9, unassigned serine peptidase [Tritrichomonas foetus]|eukprot:OHS95878.1 Clan SC, family S9, unassigned serine peptidase [Tritrichomonas foetus]
MGEIYRRAITALIRPKRHVYNEDDLPLSYNLDYYGEVIRTPVKFYNSRKQKIIGSLYKTQKYARGNPCVIYLHGNSSSQYEGRFLVQLFVPIGISVFCFDFSGSGISDGTFVTLGYHEKKDLTSAIEYLKKNHNIHKIALWGRSMGAATAIYALAEHPYISSAVLDSPFSVLREVILSLGKQYHVGIFMTNSTIEKLRTAALDLADFDINEVNPICEVKNCYSPVFFIHAKNDVTIPIEQSIKLFNAYETDLKEIKIVPGDHYSNRPPDVLQEATKFICESLGLTIEFD